MRTRLVLTALCWWLLAATAWATTLADLPLPGPVEFQNVARDVIGVVFAIDPSMAAYAGLFDDAAQVPSYSEASVRGLVQRLDNDLTAMRGMRWRTWPVDLQIDFRWIYANAELARRELMVERIFEHRPGAWLEPLANDLIALITYAPQRVDLQEAVIARIPGLVAEMQAARLTTTQDEVVARGLIAGVEVLLRQLRLNELQRGGDGRLTSEAEVAVVRFLSYMELPVSNVPLDVKSKPTKPDDIVIGGDNYAWRLRHALLLPWTPDELLALAQQQLTVVDGQLAGLSPPTPPPPTAAQLAEARVLTRDRLLALYDAIAVANRADIERSGIITIPAGVGPIRARETPEAMVPLTGDGGSMNQPPTLGASNVSWWNVEHFHADWPLQKRIETVVNAADFQVTSMGPYAAHEGIPGHHLQLSLARLNPDPIRSILPDAVQNEGWALYAEEAFWKAGGLGSSPQARYNVLQAFRHRIRRVVYDVRVETNVWTLQEAAKYKNGDAKKVDDNILRSINWPTQLISYFAGKMQILQLKDDYRKKMGAAFSERGFHDALLAVGSVPIVFARCKMLGEPVPPLDDK